MTQDPLRQAILRQGTYLRAAQQIETSDSHLHNALSGRDSLSGDKVLALWLYCEKAFDLETALARLTGNRRQRGSA